MYKALAAVAGLALLVAIGLPGSAQAESRITPGLQIAKDSQIEEFSSRHRRWHRRHYVRRYYWGPRWRYRHYYPYPYAYYPYGPYYYRYHHRPFVGFGIGPFAFGIW